MKIVNINDIEELILAKHEIDLIRIDKKEIEKKTNLNDFINEYASPKYIYLINDQQIPFNLIIIDDHKYLFITSEYNDDNKTEYEFLINKIKKLKYDMNNLIKLSNSDLINIIGTNNIIIYNGQYYN